MTDAPLRIWAWESVTKGAGGWLWHRPLSMAHDEYHLHTREALAQSPIVQAMIAEAFRDGWNNGLKSRGPIDVIDDPAIRRRG